MLAKTVPVTPMCSVPVGEALGLLYALEWLSDMGFDNVDFALNSMLTTNAFNQHCVDVTKFGQVLSACRCLFKTNFTDSKVEFHCQQANEVARNLAGVATLSASLIVYTNVPCYIKQIIINEM